MYDSMNSVLVSIFQPTLKMQVKHSTSECLHRDLCNKRIFINPTFTGMSHMIQACLHTHKGWAEIFFMREGSHLQKGVWRAGQCHMCTLVYSLKRLRFLFLFHAWQTQLDICESKCAMNALWNPGVAHDETPSCLREAVSQSCAGKKQPPETFSFFFFLMVPEALPSNLLQHRVDGQEYVKTTPTLNIVEHFNPKRWAIMCC